MDRLEGLKAKLRTARVYYSVPNPRSEYGMDIENADDDFGWMLYEIERLRAALAARESRGDRPEP